MPDNEQDVQAESSPVLEQALDAASPTAQDQQVDTETPTPQEGESQQDEQPVAEQERVPLHEHPRFKEVIEEKNWYRQQVEKLMQDRQQAQQPQFQQPQQPDPYAHLTPEEQRWYRENDIRVQELARREAEKYYQQNVKPLIDAGRMEIAKMTVSDFRRAHPDIRPNSPDELSIAEKINMGYQPDDAYWSVMGPRGVHAAEDKVKQQVKRTIEAKKKANVEHRSVSSKTSLPEGKLSLRERIARNFDNLPSEDKQAILGS